MKCKVMIFRFSQVAREEPRTRLRVLSRRQRLLLIQIPLLCLVKIWRTKLPSPLSLQNLPVRPCLHYDKCPLWRGVINIYDTSFWHLIAVTGEHPTLEESAAAHQAKLSKPEFQKVDVVTGEENESNVLQVHNFYYRKKALLSSCSFIG